MRTLLESNINFGNAYEDRDVIHPLAGLSYVEIEAHFLGIMEQYPGYEDYVYELNYKSHGYGAQTGWYELYGIKV
jgi:hypothetical protein